MEKTANGTYIRQKYHLGSLIPHSFLMDERTLRMKADTQPNNRLALNY